MSDTKKRILTAAVLVAIIIPPFLAGGIWIDLLMAVISFFGAYELASMSDQKPHWGMTILTAAAIILLYHLKGERILAGFALWIIVLFAIHIIYEPFSTDQVVYIYAISGIVAMAWNCVERIYDTALGPNAMIYVALACFLCDTGAWFFGRKFGRHKMIPRISPKKTWEGSIGGYLTGFLISLIYGLLFIPAMPKGLLVCGSLVLPAAAEIGDLSFSSTKRHFGIKDFGKLLPGHGGILDRIDSLVFCFMAFNALMLAWGI